MKFHWKAIAANIRSGNRLFQLLVFTGMVLVAAQWLLILLGISFTQENVFLHYTVYFGVDRAGAPTQLLWIPGVATVILIINTICALVSRSKNMRIVLLALMNAMEVLCVVICALLVIINRAA